jgi:hypothetical protein
MEELSAASPRCGLRRPGMAADTADEGRQRRCSELTGRRGGAQPGGDEVLHGAHGEGEDETGKLALGADGSGPFR